MASSPLALPVAEVNGCIINPVDGPSDEEKKIRSRFMKKNNITNIVTVVTTALGSLQYLVAAPVRCEWPCAEPEEEVGEEEVVVVVEEEEEEGGARRCDMDCIVAISVAVGVWGMRSTTSRDE